MIAEHDQLLHEELDEAVAQAKDPQNTSLSDDQGFGLPDTGTESEEYRPGSSLRKYRG